MDHPVAYDMVLDYIRHVREGYDSAGSQPKLGMEEDKRCHYVVVNSTKSNQEGSNWGLGLWDGRHSDRPVHGPLQVSGSKECCGGNGPAGAASRGRATDVQLAVWIRLPMVGPEHRQQGGDPLLGRPATSSPQNAKGLPSPMPISPTGTGQREPARKAQT